MNRDRRQATGRQPARRDGLELSARAIVMIGVSSLFMVLLGTLTVGIGLAFNVGMGLLFSTLIAVLLVISRHGIWPGR
jgi:hypothetical protein